MLFSKQTISDTMLPSISLCNSPLKTLDTICYLGVHIDEKLKFTNQAEHIRGKLNMHKAISRRINNFLPLIPSKIYYFSLIQSQILYGLVVWGGALFVNQSLNDLQSKQDKIVKALFCKFFPTKSLNEVYNLVNIPTINQLYKIRVSTYLYEILKTNKYPQLRSSTETLIFNHNYNTRNNTV